MKTTLLSCLALSLLVAFVQVAAGQKCNAGRGNGGKPIAMRIEPDNCEWYLEKACCTTDQANSVLSEKEVLVNVTTCKDLSSDCYELWNMVMCGIECSPFQADLYRVSPIASKAGFALCDGFADHLYDSCKDDEFIINGACRTPAEEFGNAEDWIVADKRFFYDDGSSDTDEPCFDSAERRIAAVGVIAVGLVVAMQFASW